MTAGKGEAWGLMDPVRELRVLLETMAVSPNGEGAPGKSRRPAAEVGRTGVPPTA